MLYWVQIWWFRRPGSTLTFWLARKSTVVRAVCSRALSCWKTSLRRFIAGSMCDVKTSSLYRATLRLPGCAPVEFFGRRIWHLTSSHFFRQNCRPEGRGSLRTSHSCVCRHIYSHLLSAVWILIHRWTRFASSFAGPNPYSVVPLDPCKSRPRSQYCAKVRTSGGCVAVFTETVSDCLCRYSSETWDIWCCFSCCPCPVSQVKYPDVTILGCWCVRAVLQANGGHNRYWLWSDVIWTLWTLMW